MSKVESVYNSMEMLIHDIFDQKRSVMVVIHDVNKSTSHNAIYSWDRFAVLPFEMVVEKIAAKEIFKISIETDRP